jgi:hypothetical protein
MTAPIALDMLRSASSEEFPVIDLGGSMRCRTGGKFPAAGNFLRPAPDSVGFLYSGQRLGACRDGFPGWRAGKSADPNSEPAAAEQGINNSVCRRLFACH